MKSKNMAVAMFSALMALGASNSNAKAVHANTAVTELNYSGGKYNNKKDRNSGSLNRVSQKKRRIKMRQAGY